MTRSTQIAGSTMSPQPSFFVTWETITPESARQGDVADYGFIHPEQGKTPLTEHNRRTWKIVSGFTLREAIQTICDNAPSAPAIAVEPDRSDMNASRSIVLHFGQDSGTGANEALSLHFPETTTLASRTRIFDLVFDNI